MSRLASAVARHGPSSSRRVVAILGTRYPDFSIEERILGPVDVEIRSGRGASADEILAVAADATVILTGATPRFDASTLSRLSCRGIVRCGVGTDNIDLEAAARAGISVARVTDYGTEAVAVHAVTLALAGIRRLIAANARVHDGAWSIADLRPLHLPSAMAAGVIGFGRIGRYAARLLAALGFRVLAHDEFAPIATERGGVTPASLDDLLRNSDVVTLHVPGLPGDRPLLTADRLAVLKRGSVLVNTARGSLIDAGALVESMRAGRPEVAALDVFGTEPPDLSGTEDLRDRLILTPHMAWYTEESELSLRTNVAQEARRLLVGERLREPVVEPAGVGATTDAGADEDDEHAPRHL